MTPKQLVVAIMDDSGLSNVEIARHVGLHESEIRRVRNLEHFTKYERLQEIASALGYEFHVVARPYNAEPEDAEQEGADRPVGQGSE